MLSLEELIDVGEDSHRLLNWDAPNAEATQVI